MRWPREVPPRGGAWRSRPPAVRRRPIARSIASINDLACRQIEPGRRLVEHEHPWLAEHRAREQHALSLALAAGREDPIGEITAPDGARRAWPRRGRRRRSRWNHGDKAARLPVSTTSRPCIDGGNISVRAWLVWPMSACRRPDVTAAEGEAQHAGRPDDGWRRAPDHREQGRLPTAVGADARPPLTGLDAEGDRARAPAARRSARRRHAARPRDPAGTTCARTGRGFSPRRLPPARPVRSSVAVAPSCLASSVRMRGAGGRVSRAGPPWHHHACMRRGSLGAPRSLDPTACGSPRTCRCRGSRHRAGCRSTTSGAVAERSVQLQVELVVQPQPPPGVARPVACGRSGRSAPSRPCAA